MSVRGDLKLARPWRAEPEDARFSGSAWRVVVPKRFGEGEMTLVGHLDREDAEAIAAAGNKETP